MEINLNGESIELKPFGMRAMLLYENIKGDAKMPDNLTDMLTFIYCLVIASSKKYDLKFEDFIDYLDQDPEVVSQIVDWITNTQLTTELIKKN